MHMIIIIVIIIIIIIVIKIIIIIKKRKLTRIFPLFIFMQEQHLIKQIKKFCYFKYMYITN